MGLPGSENNESKKRLKDPANLGKYMVSPYYSNIESKYVCKCGQVRKDFMCHVNELCGVTSIISDQISILEWQTFK